jgi:arsenate reductase-like glutaredoxin family protein
MNVAKKELLLIYNSAQIKDREAYAYAKSLKDHKLKKIDLKNDSLTSTQLKQITQYLDVTPNELVDRKSPKYLKYFSGTSMSDKNTLKALKQNPGMIKTPIAVYHDSADFISTPYEFIKQEN